MSKKNRNKQQDQDEEVIPADEELDKQDQEEDQPQQEENAVAETKHQSLTRRIRETAKRLADSATAATQAREGYLALQADYDVKFQALQDERTLIAQGNQDYIDACDAHSKIQGDLAKLQAELASQK